MKKAEMKPFKERLLLLRARLQGDVSSLANVALVHGSNAETESGRAPADIADLGSSSFEQDNNLLLMDNEEETLAMIEDALERIKEGTYGQCTDCEGKIPKVRLEAIPFTPFCVKCASKNESHKKR